jgi:hypothetical protein
MEQILSMTEIEEIYDKLVESKFSQGYITIFFFVKYFININTFDFTKKKLDPIIEESKLFKKNYKNLKDIIDLQNELNKRFNSRCVLTESTINEICYFSKNSYPYDMDNCLLLNKQHGDYFNKYIWSINPETLDIEINYHLISKDDVFIMLLENIKLDILEQYPEMIEFINEHYETFLYYERNNNI